MATTTNYGWTTPDDTALVKDGAAAIRTLGSSVDTTTKALNPSTTLGDIEYRSSTANTNTRLPIGTSGQFLSVVGGVPAWATATDQTPLTTKGDLFTFTTVDARLGVGANGTTLIADSAEATGLKWATPTGSLTLLSTTTLSGSSTTISSISGSYTNLQIKLTDVHGTNASSSMDLQFNSDTGSNYYGGFIYPIGTTASTPFVGFRAATQHQFGQITAASTNHDKAQAIINVFDYTSTGSKFLTTSLFVNTNSGSQSSMWLSTGNYAGGSAITSLTISTNGGTYSGGTVQIYGVK